MLDPEFHFHFCCGCSKWHQLLTLGGSRIEEHLAVSSRQQENKFSCCFQNDLMKKNDELEALRQQHDLLKKMLNQQEQVCQAFCCLLVVMLRGPGFGQHVKIK